MKLSQLFRRKRIQKFEPVEPSLQDYNLPLAIKNGAEQFKKLLRLGLPPPIALR